MGLNCVIMQLIKAINSLRLPHIWENEVTECRIATLKQLFCNLQTGCRVCPGWARQSDETRTAPAPQLRGAFSAPEGGACCQQVTIWIFYMGVFHWSENVTGEPDSEQGNHWPINSKLRHWRRRTLG